MSPLTVKRLHSISNHDNFQVVVLKSACPENHSFFLNPSIVDNTSEIICVLQTEFFSHSRWLSLQQQSSRSSGSSSGLSKRKGLLEKDELCC